MSAGYFQNGAILNGAEAWFLARLAESEYGRKLRRLLDPETQAAIDGVVSHLKEAGHTYDTERDRRYMMSVVGRSDGPASGMSRMIETGTTVSTAEAAKEAGVTDRQMRRLASPEPTGKGLGRKSGGRWLIDAEALDLYLSARRQQ